MSNKKHIATLKKFIRYFLVALSFFLLYIFLLRLLTDIVWLNYLISAIISFTVAAIGWFLFQKYYTFRNKSNKHVKQLLLFSTFLIIWLFFDLLVLRIWVGYFWFYYLYVAILSKGITFLRNFSMNHFFTFHKND